MGLFRHHTGICSVSCYGFVQNKLIARDAADPCLNKPIARHAADPCLKQQKGVTSIRYILYFLAQMATYMRATESGICILNDQVTRSLQSQTIRQNYSWYVLILSIGSLGWSQQSYSTQWG